MTSPSLAVRAALLITVVCCLSGCQKAQSTAETAEQGKATKPKTVDTPITLSGRTNSADEKLSLGQSAKTKTTNTVDDVSPTQQPRLEIDLIDGSHIIGVPSINAVPVQTTYAKMDVLLKEIRRIRFDADHRSASIDLDNGDSLNGVISCKPFQLQTVLGSVSVSFEKITQLRTALPEKLTIDFGNGVSMEFVLIHPGSFTMGSEKGFPSGDGADKPTINKKMFKVMMGLDNGFPYERPAHKVTITKPVYLSKYEVTQEQWEKIMGSNPSHFKGTKNPVESVSWENCQDFMTNLNMKLTGRTARLPTDAEWEYACRAGTTTRYSFGDDMALLGDYAWYDGNSGGTTHPVGEKKANNWGLYDMHGNVLEWCADWYGPYTAEDQTDPVGPPSGSSHVLRGGSWFDFIPANLLSTFRVYFPGALDRFGFRVALEYANPK